MKKAGNVIFVIGMTGFILGSCGYDSQPVICWIIAMVGILIAYAGYRISEGVFEFEEMER
jgi:hypothetical protein